MWRCEIERKFQLHNPIYLPQSNQHGWDPSKFSWSASLRILSSTLRSDIPWTEESIIEDFQWLGVWRSEHAEETRIWTNTLELLLICDQWLYVTPAESTLVKKVLHDWTPVQLIINSQQLSQQPSKIPQKMKLAPMGHTNSNTQKSTISMSKKWNKQEICGTYCC